MIEGFATFHKWTRVSRENTLGMSPDVPKVLAGEYLKPDLL